MDKDSIKMETFTMDTSKLSLQYQSPECLEILGAVHHIIIIFTRVFKEYSFQEPRPPLKEYSHDKNDDFQFKLRTVLY